MWLNVHLFIIESSFYSSLLLPVEVLTFKIIYVRIIMGRMPKQGAAVPPRVHHAGRRSSFLRSKILVFANQLKVKLCKQYYFPSVNFVTKAYVFIDHRIWDHATCHRCDYSTG